MSRISQSISGLLQGVSEMSEDLRMAQHGRRQINLYDRWGKAKTTRPPTEHLNNLGLTPLGPAYMHQFRTSDGENMTALFLNGVIKLFANGVQQTVAMPSGNSYLNTLDAPNDIRAVTAGDTTYIINRSVPVEMDPTSVVAEPETEILLHFRTGGFGASYTLYLTWSNVFPFFVNETIRLTRPGGTDPTTVDISDITADFHALLNSTATVAAAFTIDSDPQAGVIRLKRNDGSFFISHAEDTLQGEGVRLIQGGAVEVFEHLPKKAFPGFRVRVKGSNTTQFDDYWVKYGPSPTGEDAWNEVVAPGIPTTFYFPSFVWQLTKIAGVWTAKPGDYVARNAGDDTTCPLPSFVGKKLTSVFHWQGRLGLCAGENVILSQAAKPFNFFRQTARQLLADDVIDVKASGRSSGSFHSAVEWLGRLWLWSSSAQYTLSGDPVLSPQTVRMDRETSFENSTQCAPVVSGSRVFFAGPSGRQYESIPVFEYALPASGNDTPTATLVNEHCPTFVYGTPRLAVGDDSRGFYMVLTEDFSGHQTLYPYCYAFSGGERVQSSWSEWSPPNGSRVAAMAMRDGIVTLLLTREGGTFIETLNLDFESTLRRFDPEGRASYLDRRVLDTDSVVTIDYSEGVTTWTLPYTHNNSVVVACVDDGTVIPSFYSDVDAVSAEGDWTNVTVAIGQPYECSFELGTIRFRDARTGAPRLDGRLQLQSLDVNHTGTALAITVTNGPRVPVVTAGKRASIFGKTEDVTLTLSSAGPAQFAVSSVEWTGSFTPNARRVG